MTKTDMITPEESVPEENVSVRSHESLFGFFIVSLLVVLILAIVSYGGWLLYGEVKSNQVIADRVSIEDIPRAVDQVEDRLPEPLPDASTDVREGEAPSPESVVVDKKVSIKVLNGGATKGTASVAAGVLMGSGYSTVSTGNAIGDYTGVTVYFKTPATEADANAVKEVLLKKYPGVVVKQAVASNADTNAGTVTAIVGK